MSIVVFVLREREKGHLLLDIIKDSSVAYRRLLAREGISADQLTRDLKSFELKVRVCSTELAVDAVCFIAVN
jgi:hypothetical protein